MPEVIIVGAGIIGAASAYHLQKSGAQVTMIDAGNANATAASFGWINASFFANNTHFELKLEGIQAYHRLRKTLPLPVNWSGCLCWENDGKAFDEQFYELKQLGYDVEEIDAAAFVKLEPNIPNPPVRCLLFQGEAAAESRELANVFLEAAVENGASLLNGVEVEGFVTAGERVTGVKTAAGTILADETLIAAGIATKSLANLLDIKIPMLDRPALVIKTQPVKPIIDHILVSNVGEVRQLPDGSILMPASVGHQGDDASQITGPITKIADQALNRLRGLLPSPELELAQVTLAHRPVPADNLPVVGPVKPGLYVATLHSGITLGALMGELIAKEMVSGIASQTEKWLAPYRPQRFAN